MIAASRDRGAIKNVLETDGVVGLAPAQVTTCCYSTLCGDHPGYAGNVCITCAPIIAPIILPI